MDDLEKTLHSEALRPEDEAFTRRVLAALPESRPAPATSWRSARRSLDAATLVGLGFALLLAAERWYHAGPGGTEAVALLLVLLPLVAATVRMFGPLVPASVRRLVSGAGRHWR